MHKKTILVLEDEKALHEAIKDKLEKHDFNVVLKRDVDEAIRFLESGGVIDAVWLDHQLLGNKNGVDFVLKIKKNESSWSHAPIFVVSNSDDMETVKNYTELGVNKYYVKSNHKLEEIVNDLTKILG